MIKNSYKTAVLAALISLPLFFMSCKITVSDSQYLTRPDTGCTSSGIAIRLPVRSTKTESVNIYRREVLGESEFSEPSCIGILFPKNIDSFDQTYMFEDTYLIKNKIYQYRARLCNIEGEYNWTNWSDKITAKNGLAAGSALKYESVDGKLFYYEVTNQFGFKGSILPPDGILNFDEEGFKPALVIKDNEENLMQMVVLRNFTDKYYAKEILKASFYEKDICIEGILAYKTEYTDPKDEDEEPKIKRLILTETTSLDFYKEKEDGTSEQLENNIINIVTTPVNQGYDISTEKTI